MQLENPLGSYFSLGGNWDKQYLYKSDNSHSEPKINQNGTTLRRIQRNDSWVDWRSVGVHGARSRKRLVGGETLDPIRRTSGRHLDRVYEHSSGRQQEAVSELRADFDSDSLHDHDVRSRGSGSRQSGHCQQMWNGLYGTC